MLSVSDNGLGMPKAIILALTKGDSNGLGTGLNNIKQRLRAAYGTELSITSTINAGTTININIPLSNINIPLRSDQSDVKSHAG